MQGTTDMSVMTHIVNISVQASGEQTHLGLYGLNAAIGIALPKLPLPPVGLGAGGFLRLYGFGAVAADTAGLTS